MIELPLVAAAGILGSAHCLGMCGPFALMIASSGEGGRCAARRQAVFTVGRLTVYAFLGTLAGLSGAWLAHYQNHLLHASAFLALLAGGLLVSQAAASLSLIRMPRPTKAAGALCLAARSYRSLLTSHSMTPVLLAGVLTGFLPCGLLYGMVALAATTHSAVQGGLVMLTFGLGTVPALWSFGWASGRLSVAWRGRVWRFAAVAILVTGIITIGRGVIAVAQVERGSPTEVCPFCGE